MGVLQDQLTAKLLPGMYIPQPLELLFSWIENNHLFVDTDEGKFGFLFPEDQMNRAETERWGGTDIKFIAEGNVYLKHWFGHEKTDVLNRLCVFAKTGGDGSMAAFWLDDDGNQKIVHLGSGSGSILVCVLADDFVDFLRLLAIGYDEICWIENFSEPPNTDLPEGSLYVHPNTKYQNWVRETFSVAIPQTAIEIVKHPSNMGDTDSLDPFFCWTDRNAA
ncbi:MAG TPA: SMI1/KNR4 family protein [Blastocatellia bacterium]|nr:SMI1/KNR4 family protein [Blastocatellia bacterium]